MRKGRNKQRVLSKKNVLLKTRAAKGSSNQNIEQFLRKHPEAHVCIIRSLGGIGDVLMTTPALRELKRRHPNCTLTYAIDRHRTQNDVYYQIVYNAPFIDHIVDARFIDRNNFDITKDISAVCIRYEQLGLPSINRIDLFARALGIHHVSNKKPFLHLTHEEITWARSVLKGMNKTVVLHSASNEGKRSWVLPEMLKLVEQFKSQGISVIVFDANRIYSDWNKFSNVLDGSDLDLRKMSAIINECDLFIGPDSGPMHIAGALGTRSIVLFGSIPPEARINYYPSHTAIQNRELSCLGCWYARCPIKVKCMSGITSEMVFAKAKERLYVK